MHWLDVTLLALLALGACLGFWSGLIMQVARLLCFGLSIYLTFLHNEPVTRLLHERVAPEAHVNLLRGVAYIVVFLVVYISLFALSRLIYRVVRATKLETLDRLAGAVLGAFKMTLVLAPICALLAMLSQPATDEWMKQSKIAPVLAQGLRQSTGTSIRAQVSAGYVVTAQHDLLAPEVQRTLRAAGITAAAHGVWAAIASFATGTNRCQ